MSRYLFRFDHVRAPTEAHSLEFDDFGDAKLAAVRMLAEQLQEWPDLVWESDVARLVVADETGLTLFEIEMSANTAPAMSRRQN